jgi:UDPglucose--hexose-1-phosphate uridylyltransferase
MTIVRFMFKTSLKKPDGRALHLYSLQPIESEEAPSPRNDGKPAHPHLRWHPLRQEWVIFASHRQDRTFLPPKDYSPLGLSVSKEFPTELPVGNYEVAVFDNLFPSLNQSPETPSSQFVPTKSANGFCEVVVFTQDADASLGALTVERVKLVLDVIAERCDAIGATGKVQYVLPFENRGVEMGVTLHHPHGQIYSYPFTPPVPAQTLKSMREHWEKTGEGLFASLIQEEKKDGRRILMETEHTIAFIPVCARYPYETWIAPKRAVAHFSQLTEQEMTELSTTLKTMLQKFDLLWNKPFPYLMTFFQGPYDGQPHPEVHSHIQIFPPYRTKDRLKYLAGTELGAGTFVNDSLPEEKAAELRAVEI